LSFESLDHTADTAVRLRSRDPPELFADATRALSSIYLGPAAAIAARDAVPIRLEAESPEALLIDYLNHLIFLFDTRRFLAAEIVPARLALGSPSVLEGRILGETFDPGRHEAQTEIKAATFHGLEIRKTDSGLETDVVFDL
jgi:SHS2 domain-containing protein